MFPMRNPFHDLFKQLTIPNRRLKGIVANNAFP